MTDKNAYLDDDSSATTATLKGRLSRRTTGTYDPTASTKPPKAPVAPVAAPKAPAWPFRPEPKACAHQEAVDELAAVVAALKPALTEAMGAAPTAYVLWVAANAILDRASDSVVIRRSIGPTVGVPESNR